MYIYMVTINFQGDYVNLECLIGSVFFFFNEIFLKYKEENYFKESDESALIAPWHNIAVASCILELTLEKQ